MGKSKENNIDRDRLVAQAYELRLQSYSYRMIAYELGVAVSTAFQYVKEAHNSYIQIQESNLNNLRNERIEQIQSIIRSRLNDLKNCRDIENPETGRLERDGIRGRSYVVNDLLKLYQELNKLEGLYDVEKVEKFIVVKETKEEVDLSKLSDDEVMKMFQDIQDKASNE